jgi:hypothetical protein
MVTERPLFRGDGPLGPRPSPRSIAAGAAVVAATVLLVLATTFAYVDRPMPGTLGAGGYPVPLLSTGMLPSVTCSNATTRNCTLVDAPLELLRPGEDVEIVRMNITLGGGGDLCTLPARLVGGGNGESGYRCGFGLAGEGSGDPNGSVWSSLEGCDLCSPPPDSLEVNLTAGGYDAYIEVDGNAEPPIDFNASITVTLLGLDPSWLG